MEFKINFSGTGHRYTQDEIAVVVEAMQNADPLTQGKYRDTFEQKFCEYNGNKYAFSVCNATAALELAAQLCIFKNDDEIVAPSHTFTSNHSERALTTDAPTPCKPPETLYPPPPNFPPA